MANNLYNFSVPLFIHHFDMLAKILKKGERYAEKKKIDKDVLINSRLIADMFPLTRQIQIATDMVRLGMARMSNKKAPSFKDNEKTFAELDKRIQKTILFLKKIKPQDIQGAEEKPIEFSIRTNNFKFKNGEDYLKDWIIPHFFFHMTTTYNILRINGVNLGKRDFVKF